MSRRHFNAGTLTAPLPPALVTVGEGEEANIITIGWTGILCSTPPVTYISVRPSRHSHALLKKTGEFVIHLPCASMARQVDYCGIYTGAKVDKFKVCGFTKQPSRTVGAPTIAECPIALECRVSSVRTLGTHDVFEADILSVSCDERLLDEAGKIHMECADLIAYAHGEYFALGRSLGTFGFSTHKDTSRSISRTTSRSASRSAPRDASHPHSGRDKSRRPSPQKKTKISGKAR